MDGEKAIGILRQQSVDGQTTSSASFSEPPLTTDAQPQAHWRNIFMDFSPRPSACGTKPWCTTWKRFGPLSGIFALLLATVSLIASLGILAGSDGQKVDDWSAQPSTYLAIYTAVANLSVRYATYQGLVIAWWGIALKGGSLSNLHQSWHAGTSLRGAVTAGRGMGLVGLACIFSTLVTIDGPLLQRASKVNNVPNHGVMPINVTMTPELPQGFSGTWETTAQSGTPGATTAVVFNSTVPTVNGSAQNNIEPALANNLTPFAEAYSRSAPIGGVVHGCPGACTAKMQAPALFPSSCTTHTIPANPWMQFNFSLAASGLKAPPLETFGFLIAVELLVDVPVEAIDLITGAATYGADCTGELVYKVCNFEAGIGEYDVLIQNNHILTDMMASPTFIAFANNTAVNRTDFNAALAGHPSTLSALAWLSFYYLESETQCSHVGTNRSDKGFACNSFGANIANTFAHYQGDSSCPPNYDDPYNFAFNSLNKMMFYLGAGATALYNETYLQAHMDPGLSIYSTTYGYLQGNSNVYHTDYWWFLGAAIVEFVCILFVLPTYWGWWRLGRSVSLSPLEMAKAFESPLLSECKSNSTGRELASQTGETIVRYGNMAASVGGKFKLAFGDLESSIPPDNGTRFDV